MNEQANIVWSVYRPDEADCDLPSPYWDAVSEALYDIGFDNGGEDCDFIGKDVDRPLDHHWFALAGKDRVTVIRVDVSCDDSQRVTVNSINIQFINRPAGKTSWDTLTPGW